LAKIPKSQLPLSLELALARDEFLTVSGREIETGPLSITALCPQAASALSPLLDQLPGAKQPRLLEALRVGLPTDWPTLFVGLLPRANGRVAEVITQSFIDADAAGTVATAVDRLLRERNVTCDFLFWLCKNRPQIYGALIEPQLFMAILSVLEKDQFSEIKKGTKLYELVLSDKSLTASILKDAQLADVRDITRAIMLSPVFEELDKRSLLATIIKLYPDVQAMVAGENKTGMGTQESKLVVSWPSLRRRKAELDDIISKQIPQNTKDIQIARGYGDLKENHEYKSAKEMQTVLMARKAEYEQMLSRAEASDFSNPDLSQVSLGTKVFLREVESNKALTYTVLGAWDSDVKAGIISYQTVMAQALLNHKVNDVLEIRTEDGSNRKVRVEKIEPHGIDLSVPN
jgi:transcription elongation GreA/GreB family factor